MTMVLGVRQAMSNSVGGIRWADVLLLAIAPANSEDGRCVPLYDNGRLGMMYNVSDEANVP